MTAALFLGEILSWEEIKSLLNDPDFDVLWEDIESFLDDADFHVPSPDYQSVRIRDESA